GNLQDTENRAGKSSQTGQSPLSCEPGRPESDASPLHPRSCGTGADQQVESCTFQDRLKPAHALSN
nr:hypothetical protein [Tanacetum cinerariifolium]